MDFQPRIFEVILSVALLGLTAACVGSFPLALAIMFAIGICNITYTTSIQNSLQMLVPDHMRGRVMGLYGLIFRGAPAIGALAAGLASAHFGLRWPVLFGALLVAAACAWTFRRRAGIAAMVPTQVPLAPREEGA